MAVVCDLEILKIKMLKKSIIFAVVFQSFFVFSQRLEDEIYNAVDDFNNNKSLSTLKELENKESIFKLNVSSKSEQVALVYLQCNIAYDIKQLGDFNKAIKYYENAWQNYSKNQLEGYDIIEFCLKPMGNLYTITKDYTNAENTIHQYIFLAEKEKNLQQKIAGIINLSILYQSLGKHRRVLKLVSEGLSQSKVSTIQRQKLLNISTNSKIALNLINDYEEIPKLTIDDYQFYLNSSQLALNNKNFELAKEHFKKAKNLFFKNKSISARMLAKLYVYESQLFLQVDETDKAKKSLLMALQTLLPNNKNENIKKEDLYAENTFIDIFDLLGDIESSITALNFYDLSFYVSSLLNDKISSQEAKIVNQVSERIRSEKCIRILFDTYSQSLDNKLLEIAFQYAESSKATVLKDVVRKKSLLELHPKDSLLLTQQRLLQAQEFITNKLINEQYGKSRVIILNGFSKELSAISIQLKKVNNKILTRYPNAKNSRISFEKLTNKLTDDNAVLIEYFYGKKAIYQFMFDKNKSDFSKIELSKLNKKEIIDFIHLFDSPEAINNDINAYKRTAFNIYNTLKLNISKFDKNLIIVPDGLLSFVPFEALLTKETASVKYQNMAFLVTQTTVLYNSSVEFYLKQSRQQSFEKILGIFPVFKNSNKELTYSIDEAKSIKNLMDIDLLINEKATKENFIKKASNYDLLHLSTHANSGSFSIPASIEFCNDRMSINELYSLRLNVNLVVLSACETGVGKLQKGEGAMSLARAFQYAGAQNVLFSLWQINDKSTSQIMKLLYKNIQNTQSISKANSCSKIEYLNDQKISNIKKSPYYWSAFVYYGIVQQSKDNNSKTYLFTVIGILFLSIFYFFKNKKAI